VEAGAKNYLVMESTEMFSMGDDEYLLVKIYLLPE
jgi:hypothetical protein